MGKNKEKFGPIMFVAGGTGGSVSPILAVAETIRKTYTNMKFVFVGGRGVEEQMARQANIPFVYIPSGKWRRYFSLLNILTPFQVLAGFLSSLYVLGKIRPSVVFGTGSFVQVPLMYAARLKKIPVIIHQQDVQPGLANKLCSPIATKITATFALSRRDFSQGLFLSSVTKEDRVVVTGNPSRFEGVGMPSKESVIAGMGLRMDYPTILVVGGGTGALAINKIVWNAHSELVKYFNVIHLTGKGKANSEFEDTEQYRQIEFTDNMKDLYAAADIVLCRAGLSTITELSVLEKVAIVVPMPDSHQEWNARILDRATAAVVVSQRKLTGEMLVWIARNILHSQSFKAFGKLIGTIMPKDASKRVADIVLKVRKTDS